MLRPLASARLTHSLGRPVLSGIAVRSGRCGRYLSSTAVRDAIVKFKLHDIGEGITEVEMLKWKVTVGQSVEHFDDLCEVQSDKSTADLTSPVPGVVHKINVEEGEMVKVGMTLCEIATEGEGEAEAEARETDSAERDAAEADAAAAAAEAAEEMAEPEVPLQSDTRSEPVLETRPDTSPGITSEPIAVEEAEPAGTSVQFTGEAAILPSAPPPTLIHTGPVPERRERDDTPRKIVLSSPATRTLAGRLKVDLTRVTGTGNKGRITKEDVQRFYDAQSSAPSSSPTGESTRVEFGRTRKVMYRALGAQAEVPHFGYSHTLNLTPLLPFLKALNPPASNDKPGYLASDIPQNLVNHTKPHVNKTTLLSLLVKALLLAMEEHPIMRAKVIKGDEKWLEIKREGIVGVAVSDPKYGLLTPSLPPLPASTPLSSITTALSALRDHATKPSSPANLVISSVGGLGESTGAMPVIPPGGPLAICAVGRAKWDVEWKLRDGGMKVDPWEVEKAGLQPVLRCPVGWSGDHRVLEGAELIAFTESWKRYVEEPWRWVNVG